MKYAYAYLAALSTSAVAGCTAENPLFAVSSGPPAVMSSSGDEVDSEAGVTTTGAPQTSTSDPGTSGVDPSAPGSTQGETGVEPQTSTSTDVTVGSDSSGGSESDTGAATCGDGVLDPGEDCDDGAGNGPNQACKADCVKNVCGDGDQGPGEQCDLGLQNNKGPCTDKCQLPICGDGIVNGDEVCDLKEKNGLYMLGGCVDACKGSIPIETLKIKLGNKVKGNFPGIAGGDALCGENFKILASDGDQRIASLSPYKGDGQSETWVLRPYRGYINNNGQEVFITGAEALLGVRNGAPAPLLHFVEDTYQVVWTGISQDWTTAAHHCQKWSTNDLQVLGGIGSANNKTTHFIGNGGAFPCWNPQLIYCVEQPL